MNYHRPRELFTSDFSPAWQGQIGLGWIRVLLMAIRYAVAMCGLSSAMATHFSTLRLAAKVHAGLQKTNEGWHRALVSEGGHILKWSARLVPAGEATPNDSF
jgi:hypothetical protein